MDGLAYCFWFTDEITIPQVEAMLALALTTVESLMGEAAVRLDVSYAIDEPRRRCVVRADSDAALAYVRVFAGLLRQNYGDSVFTVERVRMGGEGGGERAA